MIDKGDIIFQLYPNVVVVNCEGAYPPWNSKDASGNIVSVDLSAVEAELAKQDYKNKRVSTGSTVYSSFADQLDMLYKDMVAGKLDTTGTWATHIKAVKDANPKP